MKSGTAADQGSGGSAAEAGGSVRAASLGCVEASPPEPSRAARSAIRGALKGAFHRLIEAADWKEDGDCEVTEGGRECCSVWGGASKHTRSGRKRP
ncbi:hypothetical protein EYF80_043671 [Liparis tanakae]|uniref:Uncharacterized protein n=1 Tax=Liparis tanakae TaxID=230148 RepID=A0A4Z2FZ48_9TELE|nr:hypothetical protein EYF80_043671 [Liparis tanakae]